MLQVSASLCTVGIDEVGWGRVDGGGGPLVPNTESVPWCSDGNVGAGTELRAVCCSRDDGGGALWFTLQSWLAFSETAQV